MTIIEWLEMGLMGIQGNTTRIYSEAVSMCLVSSKTRISGKISVPEHMARVVPGRLRYTCLFFYVGFACSLFFNSSISSLYDAVLEESCGR